ncbi:MAG: hypothetical protein OYI31_01870 [Chloroflexota bacterium]|nr:hypothetical protein [Chloroflexota bacterium]MDE2941222.1 hypothetical protein [Chloroflexota bacterium]MDE3267194.1 hypothetical protein [Chloroflexota bacterium]
MTPEAAREAYADMTEMLEFLHSEWHTKVPVLTRDADEVRAESISIVQAYGTLVLAMIELDKQAGGTLQ